MGIFTTKEHDEHRRNTDNYYRSRKQYQSQETTGPFKTWYRWKQLDFAFSSEFDRERAILNEDYIPKHNLPLGIDTYKNRLFITLPKWKSGIPCTLAVLPKTPKEPSPLLVPYPNWQWHKSGKHLLLITLQ